MKTGVCTNECAQIAPLTQLGCLVTVSVAWQRFMPKTQVGTMFRGQRMKKQHRQHFVALASYQWLGERAVKCGNPLTELNTVVNTVQVIQRKAVR